MSFFVKRFGENEDGIVAVEFALVAVAFISLSVGIFESGRMFLTWNTMQSAVESVTRYALVNTDATDDDLTARVTADMNGMGVHSEDVHVTVARTTSADGIDFLEISGNYNFQTVLGFLPEGWSNIALKSTSRFPLQSAVAAGGGEAGGEAGGGDDAPGNSGNAPGHSDHDSARGRGH